MQRHHHCAANSRILLILSASIFSVPILVQIVFWQLGDTILTAGYLSNHSAASDTFQGILGLWLTSNNFHTSI